MNHHTVQRAIVEAKRFIILAEKLKRYSPESPYIESGRDAAAAKRASMDLSRSLADMRGNK